MNHKLSNSTPVPLSNNLKIVGGKDYISSQFNSFENN